MSQVAEVLYSFGQPKYSVGDMHIHRGCGAADYPCIMLKSFDDSTLYVKPPSPKENLGNL